MLRHLSTLFASVAGVFFLLLMGHFVVSAIPAFSGWELFSLGYWDYRTGDYSALAMLSGSLVVASIAMLGALPIGIGAALYLSEYLDGKPRAFAKIMIELLAGIPSVVYGLLGIFFLLPALEPWIVGLGGVTGDSLFAAGILLGVMVLPTLVTFADDALRCVPGKLREEGLGLGLSKVQVIASIVLPRAKRGIGGAGMLALGRAIGETIAIYLVIGRADIPFGWQTFSLSHLFKAGQTLTTKLGGSELALAYGDKEHWLHLMALGVLLWVAIGMLSLASERIMGVQR